jgi:hypothetical protein
LHFRGGAVDFVRKDEVREKRAVLGGEFAGARIVDERSDEIGREEIGGELDTLETRMEAGGEGFDGERLCQAGHAFEQDVSIGQQASEQAVYELFLADDDAGDFLL